MPNHVTNTTCTASQANGESPAPLLPTHPRSAASTRPAPPRSTTHASSLVTPAGPPAGGTTPLSPAPVYKLEGSQFVRSLPAPSPGALVRGIKRRLPLGHDGAVGRPATLRRTASAAEIRDTVRALFEGTAPPRGPRSPSADGCAARSAKEPAPALHPALHVVPGAPRARDVEHFQVTLGDGCILAEGACQSLPRRLASRRSRPPVGQPGLLR